MDLLSRCEKDAQARREETGVTLNNHIDKNQRPPSIEELITGDFGEGLPRFRNISAWILHFRTEHAKRVSSGGQEALEDMDNCITFLTGLSKRCKEEGDDAGEKMTDVQNMI